MESSGDSIFDRDEEGEDILTGHMNRPDREKVKDLISQINTDVPVLVPDPDHDEQSEGGKFTILPKTKCFINFFHITFATLFNTTFTAPFKYECSAELVLYKTKE